MTTQFQTVPSALSVALSRSPDGLKAINDDGCAAAIWQRDPLPNFQAWIDHLPADQLPKARLIVRPEWARDALQRITGGCGTPDCAECQMLADDCAALAAMFADIMDAPYIRLRLDVINTNACRKFHIDALTARLICTYRGTGTQYGNAEQGEQPTDIHTVPTCSPIVLRGTDWPASPNPGLLHRSPPIEGSGETRLLFVVDPIFDREEAEAEDRQLLH